MFKYFKKDLNIHQELHLFSSIQFILGYDIRRNNYFYFTLINPEEVHNYIYNSYKTAYWCYIINNKIIFPKKSNCKKLFITYV